ncbi:hypothetical protein GQN07_23835, partial [Escherichia coli]|nr:hypothetical protein [Escherichia coli]
RNMLGAILDQAAAGARLDDLPGHTVFPNAQELASLRKVRMEAEDRGAEAPAVHKDVQWSPLPNPTSSTRQSPVKTADHAGGGLSYRPGSDVSRMTADVIVNTVNANLSKASKDGSRQEGNPVMGAGVAKAFKERYGDAILRPYGEA